MTNIFPTEIQFSLEHNQSDSISVFWLNEFYSIFIKAEEKLNLIII